MQYWRGGGGGGVRSGTNRDSTSRAKKLMYEAEKFLWKIGYAVKHFYSWKGMIMYIYPNCPRWKYWRMTSGNITGWLRPSGRRCTIIHPTTTPQVCLTCIFLLYKINQWRRKGPQMRRKPFWVPVCFFLVLCQLPPFFSWRRYVTFPSYAKFPKFINHQ